MTLDQWLMSVEIGLLILVVIQGEYIRYYEKEVHRIQSERELERRAWRESKRQQTIRKAEKTVMLDPNIQSSNSSSAPMGR